MLDNDVDANDANGDKTGDTINYANISSSPASALSARQFNDNDAIDDYHSGDEIIVVCVFIVSMGPSVHAFLLLLFFVLLSLLYSVSAITFYSINAIRPVQSGQSVE